jgi:hypothetical protein
LHSVKKYKNGYFQATKMLAKEVLAKWRLDSQCEKEIAVVVVTEDQKFWVGRSSRVPVYASEFTDIFNEQVFHHFKGFLFQNMKKS